MTPDGKRILVGIGKGNQTKANPFYTEKSPEKAETEQDKFVRKLLPYPYIGTTIRGALSIVEFPNDKRLQEYTAQVYRNCPYSDKLLSSVPSPVPTIIPTRVGDPCPIKYVIYVKYGIHYIFYF
jgi:hypothetical protein